MNPCFKEKKHRPAKYEQSEAVRVKSHRFKTPVGRRRMCCVSSPIKMC